MALLFYSDDDEPAAWRAALSRYLPDLDFRLYPDFGAAGEIDSALVWKPPAGMLRQFPNLKAILSLAAGVDALLKDRTLPDVAICRMVDPTLSSAMAEFVLTTSLFIHRDLHKFADQQKRAQWKLILPRPADSCRIGLLGLGEMGRAAGTMLKRHGFSVMGWSRSPRSIDGIACFHGPDGLNGMAEQSDILVCLLPLTAATKGMLNEALFARMPQGSGLIHAGRGPQLDEAALIAALDAGQLDFAVLDVFKTEPLPRENPLWRHPKVMVTPHAASYSTPQSGAATVAENLKRLARGEPLLHVVDRQRGY